MSSRLEQNDNVDKNKFCDKCKKDVIDFTGYKKEDILEILNSNEKICGRLDASQLKEHYFSDNTTNSSIPKLTFFIGLGSILGFTEPVHAKPNNYKTEQTEINQ